MDNHDIQNFIRSHIHFVDVTAAGAHTIKCPMCQDNTVRAAFFFESDHIGFHCFRAKCSFKSTKWTLSERIPQKFKKLMDTLGIQLPTEILLKKSNTTTDIYESLDETFYKIPNLTPITFPEDFIKFEPTVHIKFANYIASRGMSDTSYYISTDGTTKGMLIVPLILNNITYGWQGRSIDKKRFKTSGNLAFYANNGVISDSPIVVEGIWDAKSVPYGVATLHDSVNPSQAYLLRNKNPILLPDRDTTKFLEVAEQYGWRVCIPEWNTKDANDALIKYGSLAVAKMIHDGICDNILQAEIKYKMWQSK